MASVINTRSKPSLLSVAAFAALSFFFQNVPARSSPNAPPVPKIATKKPVPPPIRKAKPRKTLAAEQQVTLVRQLYFSGSATKRDRALRFLERTEDRFGNRPDFRVVRAEIYLSEKRYDQALEDLEQASHFGDASKLIQSLVRQFKLRVLLRRNHAGDMDTAVDLLKTMRDHPDLELGMMEGETEAETWTALDNEVVVRFENHDYAGVLSLADKIRAIELRPTPQFYRVLSLVETEAFDDAHREMDVMRKDFNDPEILSRLDQVTSFLEKREKEPSIRVELSQWAGVNSNVDESGLATARSKPFLRSVGYASWQTPPAHRMYLARTALSFEETVGVPDLRYLVNETQGGMRTWYHGFVFEGLPGFRFANQNLSNQSLSGLLELVAGRDLGFANVFLKYRVDREVALDDTFAFLTGNHHFLQAGSDFFLGEFHLRPSLAYQRRGSGPPVAFKGILAEIEASRTWNPRVATDLHWSYYYRNFDDAVEPGTQERVDAANTFGAIGRFFWKENLALSAALSLSFNTSTLGNGSIIDKNFTRSVISFGATWYSGF